MTIAQLIQESNTYAFSAEYFNLVKECAEIEAYGQYLKSQQYMAENPEIVESATAEFGSTYLLESVSEDNIQQIEESVKNSASKVWNFIVTKAKQLWQGITTACKNLWGKITNLTDSCKGMAKYINDNEDFIIDSIGVITDTANKYNIKIGTVNGNANISDNIRKAVLADGGKDALDLLYATLSTDGDLTVYTSDDGIGIDDAANVVTTLLGVSNPNQLAALNTYIDRCRENVLLIPISKKAISKATNSLAKAQKALDAFDANTVKDAFAAHELTNVMQGVNQASAKVFKMLASDLKVLAMYSNFKSNAMKLLQAASKGNKQFSKNNPDQGGN